MPLFDDLGRIGARYAAELGTMRVTEQIDALESLGRSPASHLIIPRVLAAVVMIPILTIPVGVLLAFVPMVQQGLTANIMSLGGIAVAIGAMVDASIIVIENVHTRLEHWEREGRPEGRDWDYWLRAESLLEEESAAGLGPTVDAMAAPADEPAPVRAARRAAVTAPVAGDAKPRARGKKAAS